MRFEWNDGLVNTAYHKWHVSIVNRLWLNMSDNDSVSIRDGVNVVMYNTPIYELLRFKFHINVLSYHQVIRKFKLPMICIGRNKTVAQQMS